METLRKYFKEQMDFQLQLLPNFGDLSYEDKVKLTKEFLLHMISETGEFLDAIGTWKSLPSMGEETRRSAILEEVIDVYKFLINIALLWGYGPEDFDREFWRKSMVVRERLKTERILQEIVKMGENTAVIDLDGIVADFWSSFIGYYNEHIAPKTGRYFTGKEGNSLTTILGRKLYLETKARYYESGEISNAPYIDGSREFLEELRRRGFRIILMTARPSKTFKRVFADTLEWLKRYKIPYDALILGVEDKGGRAAQIGVSPSFFVEDDPRQAREISSRGFRVFLVSKPYNLDDTPPGVERVKELSEILERIEHGEGN